MIYIRIILASASPRRRLLLEQIGIPCEVIESGVNEDAAGPPHEQVLTLALRKVQAVANQIAGEAIIIAADTLVEIDNQILSKPKDFDDAFMMLKALQGRAHSVYTGVAILKNSAESSFADTAKVWFRPLSDGEITAYINTGEPFDKAGAYGVQARGAVLVERIEGDFYTVMGLPISKVVVALNEMGIDTWNLMEEEKYDKTCKMHPKF